MNNFELIDDYLANRLNEQERQAFEQQVNGDPTLKSEVDFQRQIIESVKQARVAQLKSMLNNVPVGGSAWSGPKIAAGVVSAGLITTVLYFTLTGSPENETIAEDKSIKQEIVVPQDATKDEAIASKEEEITPAVADSEKEVVKQEKVKSPNVTKTPAPVRKPKIDVADVTEDVTNANEKPAITNSENSDKTDVSDSKTAVIIDSSDKKHMFHYQFSTDGKVKLYGPFDRNLYTILEIHGVNHALFLFYNENYYLMNEDQTEITQLQLIKDSQLIKKLKEYRGR